MKRILLLLAAFLLGTLCGWALPREEERLGWGGAERVWSLDP